MTAYQKSIELNLTGTDAEIVAVLRTLATNDLPVSHVAEWLRVCRLWYLSPDGYAGPLQEVYDATDVLQIKAALGEFFASVFGHGAEYIRATWPEYSVQIWAISGMIAGLIPGGESLQVDLYDRFGGRPFAGLTVEQFAADREAATVSDQRQASYSQIVSRANAATAAAAETLDAGGTPDEIIAAGIAAWGAA